MGRWILDEPVKRQLWKLKVTDTEAARLFQLMTRHLAGQTIPNRDFKHLRGDVWELRLKVAHRNFRLFYAQVEAGPVLLALHVAKKDQRRQPRDIDLAEARLKAYRQAAR